MSRRTQQEPYYDDEGQMEIVDYSTPTTAGDLSNPNASRQVNGNQPKDTVIVPSSPVHQTTRVIDDVLFITERAGPIILTSGETIDLIDLTGEAGEIVSIEVVTDNPYTGVYLEMDDYNNKEGVGITAAELIMKNKITPNHREFYAEDMREDGTFVVRYSPKDPDPYSDRIKIQVRNDVRGTSDLFGRVTNQRFAQRNGLPTPLNLGYAAGSYITDTNIASITANKVTQVLQKKSGTRYESTIRNLKPIEDPAVPVGSYHPYMGIAGEFAVVANSNNVTNVRMVSGAPGEKLSSTTGFPTPNTVAWPGNQIDGTYVPSEQQFIVYRNNTENETTVGLQLPAEIQGLRIWIKIGDTIYFPGTVKTSGVFYYDAGTSQWKDLNTEDGSGPYTPNTDGAYVFTCQPGLPFKLPKLDQPLASTPANENYDSWGVITAPKGKTTTGEPFSPKTSSGRMLIHEVVVRRKRKKTLLL